MMLFASVKDSLPYHSHSWVHDPKRKVIRRPIISLTRLKNLNRKVSKQVRPDLTLLRLDRDLEESVGFKEGRVEEIR